MRTKSLVIASVPLLVTYAAGHGVTDIVLPKFFHLRELFNVVATNGVFHLGASPRSLPDLFSRRRNNSPLPNRPAVLRLHVDAVDFLYQQHQHPRRHQRRRGAFSLDPLHPSTPTHTDPTD